MAPKVPTPPQDAMIERTMLHAPCREKIQTRLKRILADRSQDAEDLKTLLKYLPDEMPAKDESRINRILEGVGIRRY